MVPNVTLLDLVTAVSMYSRTDAEVVATVVSMVNGGKVRLCGSFRGARFKLDAIDGRDTLRKKWGESGLRPGARIRSTRTIVHPGGTLRRSAEGTVRSRRENIGRELLTVEFDSGERLVLFPHEIEPASGIAA